MLIPEAGDGGTPAPAATASSTAEGTPPVGAPEGSPPAGTPTGAPEGAPVGAPEGATNAENAEAALAGDPAAFDALPPAWQAEVRKLRSEAAKYRTEAKPFTETFAPYDEGERAFLLDVVKRLGDPDTQPEAARQLQQLAGRLLEGYEEQLAEDEKPLTVKEWQEREAARERERAEQQAVQDVITEAKGLGYEENTPDWAVLMWEAANAAKPEEKGDLAAAHARIQARQKAAIDSWVEEQRAKGAKWIDPADAGSAPQESTPPPGGWKGARERIEARIAAQRAAGQ